MVPGAVTLTPWVVGLLLATGLIVSVTDLKWQKIHNKVTFPMIVGGVVLNSLPGSWGVAAGSWKFGVTGFGAGLAILILPFAVNMIKAGDVKYLAGVGALGGPWLALFTFLYGSLAHGVFSLGVLIGRHETREAFRNIGLWFTRTALMQRSADFEAHSQGKVPYAMSLAVGLVVSIVFALLRGNVFPPWA